MGDSNFIVGFDRGVYLFGTTHEEKLEPVKSKDLAEIESYPRKSRVEKLSVPINHMGAKPFVGIPIGLARTIVGLVASAVSLFTFPFFALAKRPLPTNILGFGLSWTLLGLAEIIPYLGKLAHHLTHPQAEKTFDQSTPEERKAVEVAKTRALIGDQVIESLILKHSLRST